MPTFRQAREFLLANRTALRQGRGRLPMARSRAVQLGARLVRRGAGARGRQQGPLRASGSSTWRRARRPGSPSPSCRVRSNQVANYLRQQGLKRGDHLLLVLNNVAPLWEIMLAAMKLGVVVIPATTLLTGEELADRVERGRARMIVADEDQVAKCAGLSRDGVRVRQHQRVSRSTAGCRSAMPTRLRPSSRRTVRPTPTTRCCSISPRAPRPSPSWCATAIAATPWARCRPCTGSACSRATCTSTSPRRAGPSTPGAPSSRPGTPAPRC